jgi:hypothetical protein
MAVLKKPDPERPVRSPSEEALMAEVFPENFVSGVATSLCRSKDACESHVRNDGIPKEPTA